MKKIYLKRISILIVIIAFLLAGCSTGDQTATNDNQEGQVENEQDNESENNAENQDDTKKPVTLTYWTALRPEQQAVVTDLDEVAAYQEVQKATGIDIKFIHPPLGQETEQFNLMISSNDLPDMIKWNWSNFPGGPEAAINNNLIIKLNGLIEKYAPNYAAILKKHPEFERLIKTDNGTHYVIAGMFSQTPEGSEHLGPIDRELVNESWLGLIMRKDWLDDLNLPAPETIDEWYTTLTKFKEEKGASAPLTFVLNDLKTSHAFLGAYNVTAGLFEDNKKVYYGPIMPGFKDFLVTFNKWYKEGLIDPDFPSNDAKARDAKAQNGASGAWIGTPGSQLGAYYANMRSVEPDYYPIGVKYPVLNKGEIPKFGQKDLPYKAGDSVAITTANQHVEESLKFLDYAFTYEGDLVLNWGIEDVSYEMVDGRPAFTELLTKNPEGLTTDKAMSKYLVYAGPFSMDYGNRKENRKSYGTPEVFNCVAAWEQTQNRGVLPPTTIAEDKREEYANKMNEINTYFDEMFVKFIMGVEPIDNYDQFVNEIKALGIDEVIAIQQDALDRFYKR